MCKQVWFKFLEVCVNMHEYGHKNVYMQAYVCTGMFVWLKTHALG